MASTRARFPGRHFLLETPLARRLYHEVAAPLPIIDYHNHLPPREIAENRRFENLTRLWLAGDHYKWRAMRTLGVPERFITGDASDWEKFERWAACVPLTARNPLYHWTHMELQDPLEIFVPLNAVTASQVWAQANEKLADSSYFVRGLLKRARVEVLCTTDDPVDDLAFHKRVAAEAPGFRMFPTFRPDAAFGIEDTPAWNAWLDRLGNAAGLPVNDWGSLLGALRRRAEFFHAAGCRLSDHGLEHMYADPCPPERADLLFRRARAGERLDPSEVLAFRSALLYELGAMYAELGWTQQFHLGALRNVNSRLLREIGRDAGCDVIGDFEQARPLARALDRWASAGKLARTILYNLNPRDNEVFAAMCGAFQDGETAGKIQYGAAWWFLDQLDGMTKQIEALSNLGLLSTFVGMLTDSRSFLSFSRHAYFRRLLCNILAEDVRRGRLPRDQSLLEHLVRSICYENAIRFFRFPEKPKKEVP
ncbi:MAG: glucuronate isomerase [Kiritimatiellae bacterium]|nr:glucuronate isomerase [Kiritimatiellia bacterium]MDW8459382.1 glucuronate isomerase [Verrucomicrobiota bacterium]